MITSERLQSAGELVEWLRLSVHEHNLPATNRSRASAGCFGIAQDHHHAIVVLICHRLYASSFSLLRIEFEAFIRGLWLWFCASNEQVEKFVAGSEPPQINVLLNSVEMTPGFTEKVLSGIKSKNWRALCAYTHTGGLHIQRWNSNEAVEPNYEPDEIEEVLSFAELIAMMSALGIAQVASDNSLAQKILERMQAL
jgi:hypothetical protein